MNRPILFRIMFGALACAPAFCQPRPAQIDIQVVQPMTFGGLLVSPFGGSVTLTEDGALIPDGGGVVPSTQPPCAEARLRLTGPPGSAFTLKLDPSSPVLGAASGAPIRLAEFRCSLPGFRGTFDATGQAEVKLGGRLDIPAGTAPGFYRATQVKVQLQVFNTPGSGVVNMPFMISALVRAPLFLNATGELDFGSLIPGTQHGVFEVLPTGGHRTRHTTGPNLFKGQPGPATFQLLGPIGTSYSIQLPQRIQLMGLGQPLRVEGFTCSVATNGILPAGGLTFGVGAGLVVPPEQVPGVYRGTFMVTVNYQ
jgi:hypothetical protein